MEIRDVYEHEIKDEFYGCPYCGAEVRRGPLSGCCGESSEHMTTMYVLEDGDILSEAEVEIIEKAPDLDHKDRPGWADNSGGYVGQSLIQRADDERGHK